MFGKILYNPLAALVITLVLGLTSWSLYRQIQKMQQVTGVVGSLEAEIADLSSETALLQEKLEYVDSDFAKEKIARDELLMQQPGEIIVQLPPLPSPSPVVTSPTPASIPGQWWQLLTSQR
jgi:cell division protein FtsB